MKKILLILLISPNIIFAQEQITFLTMLVMSSLDNDKDVSKNAQEQSQFLTLFSYSDDNTKMYMSNVWVKNETQSYGVIYNIETEDLPPLEGELRRINLTYLWDYKNSYNEITGTAEVELIMFKKNENQFFEMKIFSGKDVLEYRGLLLNGSFEDAEE